MRDGETPGRHSEAAAPPAAPCRRGPPATVATRRRGVHPGSRRVERPASQAPGAPPPKPPAVSPRACHPGTCTGRRRLWFTLRQGDVPLARFPL